MSLDLSLFYLTANNKYYEYTKMPLNLFPQWIIDQYELNTHAFNGMVHIEMRKAVYCLPQAGILVNKKLRRELKPHGYSNTKIRQASGITKCDPYHSLWLLMILA